VLGSPKKFFKRGKRGGTITGSKEVRIPIKGKKNQGVVDKLREEVVQGRLTLGADFSKRKVEKRRGRWKTTAEKRKVAQGNRSLTGAEVRGVTRDIRKKGRCWGKALLKNASWRRGKRTD